MESSRRHSGRDLGKDRTDDFGAAAIQNPPPEAVRQGIEHLGFTDMLTPIVAIDFTPAVATGQSPVLLPPAEIVDQALVARSHPR